MVQTTRLTSLLTKSSLLISGRGAEVKLCRPLVRSPRKKHVQLLELDRYDVLLAVCIQHANSTALYLFEQPSLHDMTPSQAFSPKSQPKVRHQEDCLFSIPCRQTHESIRHRTPSTCDSPKLHCCKHAAETLNNSCSITSRSVSSVAACLCSSHPGAVFCLPFRLETQPSFSVFVIRT